MFHTNWVDFDYFDTYGFEIESGRKFDKSYATDSTAVLINKTAVRNYRIDKPIGSKFIIQDDEVDGFTYENVIGVVKDFHFESLRTKIAPYILRFKNETKYWGYFSIRFSENADFNTVDEIEKDLEIVCRRATYAIILF